MGAPNITEGASGDWCVKRQRAPPRKGLSWYPLPFSQVCSQGVLPLHVSTLEEREAGRSNLCKHRWLPGMEREREGSTLGTGVRVAEIHQQSEQFTKDGMDQNWGSKPDVVGNHHI